MEDWRKYGLATILKATAEPVPFEPKFYSKVEGIPGTDCQSLERRFGPDFAKVIAASVPDDLENGLSGNALGEFIAASVEAGTSPLSAPITRYSKPKQVSIITACVADTRDAREDTAS